MAHAIFVHGLANKPAQNKLHEIWLRALLKGGLDLEGQGVSTAMVYYADVLYEKPEVDEAAEESGEEKTAEQVDGSGNAELPVPENAEEARFVAALRAQLTTQSDAAIASGAANAAVGTQLERVPLPWFIKKRIMKALLRDAYLYLFNKDHSPRAGATFKVQDVVRRRFLDALAAAPKDEKIVVVSHSMGTMVAYDCLKRVATCPRVDGLITFGSPLGIDEVQDKFHPEWTRDDGYVTGRVVAPWINFYDRLDVVCGADPLLANDFRQAKTAVIADIAVTNDGNWRHSAHKYLAQPTFVQALARLLEI